MLVSGAVWWKKVVSEWFIVSTEESNKREKESLYKSVIQK